MWPGFATISGREPSICLATCWRGAAVERFEIVGIYVPARVAIPRDGRRWCNRRVYRLPNQAARHLPQNAIRALASIWHFDARMRSQGWTIFVHLLIFRIQRLKHLADSLSVYQDFWLSFFLSSAFSLFAGFSESSFKVVDSVEVVDFKFCNALVGTLWSFKCRSIFIILQYIYIYIVVD